jgi:cobaltochelatase CobS
VQWCEGETHHVGSHFIRKNAAPFRLSTKTKRWNELMKIYVAAFPEAPTMSAAAAKN